MVLNWERSNITVFTNKGRSLATIRKNWNYTDKRFGKMKYIEFKLIQSFWVDSVLERNCIKN